MAAQQRLKGLRALIIEETETGVRAILFTVAEIVRRYDPDFRAFHERLCNAEKPRKVVRVAVAHKLLVRSNAKAREAHMTIASAT